MISADGTGSDKMVASQRSLLTKSLYTTKTLQSAFSWQHMGTGKTTTHKAKFVSDLKETKVLEIQCLGPVDTQNEKNLWSSRLGVATGFIKHQLKTNWLQKLTQNAVFSICSSGNYIMNQIKIDKYLILNEMYFDDHHYENTHTCTGNSPNLFDT